MAVYIGYNRISGGDENTPTKTSELENDSNFISDADYTHTDNNFTNADKEKLDSAITSIPDAYITEEDLNNKNYLTEVTKEAITDSLGYTPLKQEDINSDDIDKHYTHNQLSSSDIWTVNHNLNKYPSATIVDSAGNIVIGEIIYKDLNNIEIHFQGAFSGKAYLN